MDIIIDWIQVRPDLSDFFIVFIVSIILMYIWCYLLGGVFLKMNLIEEGYGFCPIWQTIFFASVEELAFRFIPIVLVMKLIGPGLTLWIIIIASSIILGILHGNFFHIFLQGLWGVVFSVIFLKFGGLYGSYLIAFLVVATIHSVYNMPIYYFRKREYYNY